MKKFTVIIATLLFPVFISAQDNEFPLISAQSIYGNQIQVSNAIPEKIGDMLNVNMGLDASALKLSANEALIVTPIVKSIDGSRELPAIVISGRKKLQSDKRKTLGKHKQTNLTNIKAGSKESGSIIYIQSVPYEEWMEYSRVDFKEELVGCANCAKKSRVEMVADSIKLDEVAVQKPEEKLHISYITPPAEPVKSRNMSGEAFLDFPVGKSTISADYRRNFQELGKIHTAIKSLNDNKYASITSIELKGYASPEGPYAKNQKLSGDRSNALMIYLSKTHSFPQSLFKVASIAEDWDGLRKLVQSSNMSEKQTILGIIDDRSLQYDAKERKLKAMKKTWKTLLDDYFPLLRRVEYKLNFTIRAFSVNEGREVISIAPKEMSLNEMFLVANSYSKGSDDFNEVFDVAVKMYPTDPVANINAAASALERNDLVSAQNYLSRFPDEPSTWNNLGVLYFMQQKYSEAQSMFLKVKGLGSENAAKNIEIMKQKEEYENYQIKIKNRIEKRNKLE